VRQSDKAPSLRNFIVTNFRAQIVGGVASGSTLSGGTPVVQAPEMSVNYTGSTHRTFDLVALKSTCQLATGLGNLGLGFPLIVPLECKLRLVGRARNEKGVLVDRKAVVYDVPGTAFPRVEFGDEVKDVEEVGVEFVSGVFPPLPFGLGFLNFLFASVGHDDVEVVLRS